jgi:CubicO group peptidase (beta-lactamase class C family)
MRGIAIVALLGGLAASAAGAASQGGEMPFDEFRAQWRQAVSSAGIVGAAIAVVREDEVVFHDHAGAADVETSRAVDAETIFHWASITKTFTGVAILQLRDRGRLSLDDPAVRYVPELRAVHNPHGPIEAVTIGHLLSHSAGFRSPTWPWGGDQPWHPFEPPGWAQVAAMLPYTRVEFPPGSRFQYSNPGIVFLGRIIEHLTNEDFEVYIDKHILRPLEMRDSSFDLTPPYRLAHKSQSYVVRDGVRTRQPFDPDTGVTVSNGGLNAPVADLAKWVRFLIGRPADAATRARYDTVLARRSLEEMWRPRVDAPGEGDSGGAGAMGLAFFLETHFDRAYVGHSGHQNGFVSHFYVDPGRGVGYVVAFNTEVWPGAQAPRGTDQVDREIRDTLFTRVFPALQRR